MLLCVIQNRFMLEIEKVKIESAKKLFDEINSKINLDNMKYDVVDSYGLRETDGCYGWGVSYEFIYNN